MYTCRDTHMHALMCMTLGARKPAKYRHSGEPIMAIQVYGMASQDQNDRVEEEGYKTKSRKKGQKLAS